MCLTHNAETENVISCRSGRVCYCDAGTLPPPPQLIRVTHEALIEPLATAAAASEPAAAATEAAAPTDSGQVNSLMSYLEWDGCFVFPQDAATFCESLSQAACLDQNPETSGPTPPSPAGLQEISWIVCWANSNTNSQRLIRVGSFEPAAKSRELPSSPLKKEKHRGLKKAFFVSRRSDAASGNDRAKTGEIQLAVFVRCGFCCGLLRMLCI